MGTEVIDKDALAAGLIHFTGTEAYHAFNIFMKDVVLTDGASYLAETAGAYWLMDIIGSATKHTKELRESEFIVWTLKVSDHKGIVTATADDGPVLYSQPIEYTDFPLDEIVLWVEMGAWNPNNPPLYVIMLPSEH
jgi:hypothetical protein